MRVRPISAGMDPLQAHLIRRGAILPPRRHDDPVVLVGEHYPPETMPHDAA